MRILLVEDEPDAARMVAKGLREQAYAVDVAGDGESACFQAAIADYDAIVLDVMLPGKDGLEVCRACARTAPSVPILMLTARDAVEARVEGLDGGADDYLTKPFDFGELLARLRALIRRGAQPLLPERLCRLTSCSTPARAGCEARARGPAHRQGIRAARIPGPPRRGRWSAAPRSPSTSGTRATTRCRTSSRCTCGGCGASSDDPAPSR